MEELKRRILSDAVVGEGDIIHVDMFLNHCMDINLMEHMGNALAKRFRGVRITKVLTAESSCGSLKSTWTGTTWFSW